MYLRLGFFHSQDARNVASIEEAGRRAWTAIRYQFPSIASTVSVPNEEIHYHSPIDEKEVEDWLSNSFIVTNADASSIIRNAKPLPYATLHFNPLSQSLLLQASHWRFDAHGIVIFFETFLDLLASPSLQRVAFGDEHVRLSPPLEAAMDFPNSSSAKAGLEVGAMIDALITAQSSVGLAESANVEGPWMGTEAVRISFSHNETATLLQRAKRKCITISLAVQAALYMVLSTAAPNNIQVQQNSDEITNMSIVDLRSLCGDHGFQAPTGCLFFGLPTFINPGEFDDVVQQLDEQWKKWARTELFKDGFTRYGERLLELSLQPMPFVPSTPFVSSIGVVENYLKREHGDGDGKLRVTDYCLTDERVGREIVVFAWTFDNRFELNLAYNSGYLKQESVELFGKTLKGQDTRRLRNCILIDK